MLSQAKAGKPRPPRKYQVIWETIKKRKACIIEVHPVLFARVIKAVIKEKYNDRGFKILNEDDYLYLDIEQDKEKKRITFRLRQRIGLEEIVT